jgi:hypothetical protein
MHSMLFLCEFGIIVITLIMLSNDFQLLRRSDTNSDALTKVISGTALTAVSFLLSVLTFVFTLVGFKFFHFKKQHPNEAGPRESSTEMGSELSCAPLDCQPPYMAI